MKRHRFIPNLQGIWDFIKDPKTDWKPKVLVVLSALYLIWPLDLVPDFAPLIGWLDDLGLVSMATWYLFHATNAFLESRDRREIEKT